MKNTKKNTTKNTKSAPVAPATPAPANTPEVESVNLTPAPANDTPAVDTPAPVAEPATKGRKSLAGNVSNGAFHFVRRNDNRIRIVSDNKTIGLIVAGAKKCSICAPDKAPLEKSGLEVVTCNMGPMKFRISCDTPEVDALAEKIFGAVEDPSGKNDLTVIIPEEEAEPAPEKAPASEGSAK